MEETDKSLEQKLMNVWQKNVQGAMGQRVDIQIKWEVSESLLNVWALKDLEHVRTGIQAEARS